ncbi:MAG: endonuclease Q family protein [candidate division WOR-3 bacterium]
MEFIADFHIHSLFSRATSQDMVIPQIVASAQRKGIKLLGTGDFTHPKWLELLKKDLKPTGGGLFTCKDIYFILTAEVNNIYTKNAKLRRIHNIIFAPDFSDVERINKFLSRYGNLASDGRPTIALDSYQMLAKIKELAPRAFIVPSHIWTPWFSLYGSHSGFDSIEDCFGDLSHEIFALETGLSSDPAMNWRLSALDDYSLISNSDAHSPSRLGREANVFDCDLTYDEIRTVLKTKDRKKFLYTIEFFPEEGKYHYDGHRNCKVRLSPKQSVLNNDLCPVCGRRLTIGVLHRVESLADRPEGFIPENAIPYKNLVPLEEIIAEALGVGRDTAAVRLKYENLVKNLGGEFTVLLSAPIEAIKQYSDERIALGVAKMRQGEITVIPGYDGVFGTIKIFSEETQPISEKVAGEQMTLF